MGACMSSFATASCPPTIFFANAREASLATFKKTQFRGTAGGPVVIPRLYNGEIGLELQRARSDRVRAKRGFLPDLCRERSARPDFRSGFANSKSRWHVSMSAVLRTT